MIKYDSESITNSFNEFFSSVGESLAKQQTCKAPELEEYLRSLNQYKTSIFLPPTTTNEILALIKKSAKQKK